MALGSITGLFPLTRKCTHNEYLTASFKESPILIKISYVNAISLLSISCYEFYSSFDTKISAWKVHNITAIGFLFFGFCSGLTAILQNRHSSLMILILDGFSSIATSNFVSFTTQDTIAKLEQLHHKSIIYVVMTALFTILGGLTPYLATKRWLSLVTAAKTYSFCVNCFSISLAVDAFTIISKLLFNGLQKVLIARINGERVDIYNDLKMLIKIRLCLQQIVQILNLYVSPPGTVFYTTTLLFSFSCIYVAIIEILQMVTLQDFSCYRILWPLILLHVHYVCQSITNLMDMVRISKTNVGFSKISIDFVSGWLYIILSKSLSYIQIISEGTISSKLNMNC